MLTFNQLSKKKSKVKKSKINHFLVVLPHAKKIFKKYQHRTK